MNHSIFSNVALFSILILVGAGCFSSNNTNNQTGNDSDGFIGSYAEALTLGQSMKCTWSSPDGDGITYMKGDKIYTSVFVDDVNTYIVDDGTCSYIWSDNETEGMEFCVPEDFEDDFEDFTDAEDYSSEEFENSAPDDTDVDCKRQNIPNSQFDLPSNITFINPLESFLNF